MLEEKLLKILIKEIIKEENTKLRTSKGYGASHPVINRKPFMLGLGKSEYDQEPKKRKKKKKDKPVKVSKAFNEDMLEDYQTVLEGLINGKTIFK